LLAIHFYNKRIKNKTKNKNKRCGRKKMKIVTIIVLVVIALFLLLPILSGSTSIPGNFSATEIGDFISGYVHYWFTALKMIF